MCAHRAVTPPRDRRSTTCTSTPHASCASSRRAPTRTRHRRRARLSARRCRLDPTRIARGRCAMPSISLSLLAIRPIACTPSPDSVTRGRCAMPSMPSPRTRGAAPIARHCAPRPGSFYTWHTTRADRTTHGGVSACLLCLSLISSSVSSRTGVPGGRDVRAVRGASSGVYVLRHREDGRAIPPTRPGLHVVSRRSRLSGSRPTVHS